MKSKDEMIDALQIHVLEPDCKGCAYISEFNEKEHPCYMSMINDIVDTLSKSDFEVMCNILSKSEELYADSYVAMSGHKVIPVASAGEGGVALIRFDEEGNIL